jgi:hypothetical protein
MGRIGRLLNKIQDLDYKLVYQPGSSNYTADLFPVRPSKPTQSLIDPLISFDPNSNFARLWVI